MTKSPKQLQREIDEVLHSPRRIAAVGFGSFPSSKLPTPPRFAARMASMQYKPTRGQRRDPTLPKGETFTVMDRNGTVLGESKTAKGAMALAPKDKSYAIVRGEYTSDGRYWGPGGGRQVAVREFHSSGGFRWYEG